MNPNPAPLSYAPEAPFRFVGGHPALDLINTVDWTSRGLENDRLASYQRLADWGEAAGLLPAGSGPRLIARAGHRAGRAERALGRARELRGVLARLFRALASNESAREALLAFDPWLARAHRRLTLVPGGGGPRAVWTWRKPNRLDALLWPLIRSAGELASGAEIARVRVCAGPDCGWMYVDRSRNGLRRWCQMETCGTREKSRRRARRSS